MRNPTTERFPTAAALMHQWEADLTAREAAQEHGDEIDNLARILAAKPGEIVRIIPPFPGYDTGWLLMLDKCPSYDKPHVHNRETGECLAEK